MQGRLVSGDNHIDLTYCPPDLWSAQALCHHADHPHPDCPWPDSRTHVDRNLAALPEHVRRKITYENVVNLYGIR